MRQRGIDIVDTILYYINKEDPLGPLQKTPSQDPQYALWQIGINNWLLRHQEQQLELE